MACCPALCSGSRVGPDQAVPMHRAGLVGHHMQCAPCSSPFCYMQCSQSVQLSMTQAPFLALGLSVHAAGRVQDVHCLCCQLYLALYIARAVGHGLHAVLWTNPQCCTHCTGGQSCSSPQTGPVAFTQPTGHFCQLYW